MKVIAFFVRHFTERGTEVAIYDYAHYNETILGNRSIIICFTEQKRRSIGWPTTTASIDKFAKRFPIIEIDDIHQMKPIILTYSVDTFYTLTHGMYEEIYRFNDISIWGNCKKVKHCVFETTAPQNTIYCGISEFLNTKFGTNIPIIPHIISLPACNENLRHKLEIPENAIVFGRYGATDTFDIIIAHDAIKTFLEEESNVYFLFMNTNRFHIHPRIIHIDGTTELIDKTKFINTCDAMIHAREHGETFGISIGEFSILNKPVITSPCGDLAHISILGDKAILYKSVDELVDIFRTIQYRISLRSDWNAYSDYSPEKVMEIFRKITGV